MKGAAGRSSRRAIAWAAAALALACGVKAPPRPPERERPAAPPARSSGPASGAPSPASPDGAPTAAPGEQRP